MIEIKNIFAGWLTFEIHYGKINQLFTVSYLNDFRDDINYLLGVNMDDEKDDYSYKYAGEIESRAIFLDGEGTLLKLSAMKYEFDNEIAITWWLDDNIPVVMVYNYSEFVENWLKEMQKNEDSYKKYFLIDFEEDDDE